MNLVVGIIFDIAIVWLLVSTYRAAVRTRHYANDTRRLVNNASQRLRKMRKGSSGDGPPGR